MKAGTTYFSSPQYYRDHITGYTSTASKRSWQQVLTCNGVVKGNRKAPNPWAYRIVRTTGSAGTYIYSYNGRIQNSYSGQLTESPYVPDWDLTVAANNAYNTCLSKLNANVRGQLDLTTSLAESGQTYKMLNLVSRVAELLVDMRNSYRREVVRGLTNKLSKRKHAQRVKQWESGLSQRHPGLYRPTPREKLPGIIDRASALAANGWLEWTYGVKPLLSDIYGIADQLVRHTRNSMVIKAKVRIPDEKRQSVPLTIFGYSGVTPATYTGFCACTISVKMLPNFDKGLSQWLSLNPLGVAYELTPLSFVLDWVFDLGSYMRNLETSVAYSNSFESGFVSQLTHYNASAEASGSFNAGSGNVYYVDRAHCSKYYTDFVRYVLSSYPTPRAPMFEMNLGSARLLSAAALLRQLL